MQLDITITIRMDNAAFEDNPHLKSYCDRISERTLTWPPEE